MTQQKERPRVLVVDDEAAVARALVRLLSGAGFSVSVAQDVATARALLAEDASFAVVISDERMPGGERGVDLLESCARDFPATTRLLLTGHADAQAAAEAVNRAEIFRLFYKPWSNEDLVDAVREAAWRSALLREALT